MASGTGNTLRHQLLRGASLSTLLIAAGAPSTAQAAAYRSLPQALAAAARVGASASASVPSGVAASRQAALGVQNLTTAATRLRNLSQALAAASAAVPRSVPQGLAPGGLQVGAGVTVDGVHVAVPGLWSGASLPTQASSASGTTVSIIQSQPLAQLTWRTFNVGARTHLVFNQSAGGAPQANWVVINKVEDPAANPSLIEGEISAPGKVYVLNRNGIAFGAGSQVNVGSLVAATADIAQQQFGVDAQGQASFSLFGPIMPATGTIAPTFVNGSSAASVTVDPGAAITTAPPASAASGGGYVLLFGGTIANAGLIGTPHGQAMLAAGTSLVLRPGYSPATNPLSTTLGIEAAIAKGGGTVTNSGVIVADQGDATLVGHAIDQAGVILSTTTVDTRGTVHLLTDATDGTAGVVLAPGSVTEVLPEDDGQTALDSQRAADVATSVTLNTQRQTQALGLNDSNRLADQLGSSRIEISSGGSVDLQPGALAVSPGGQIAVGAGRSVLVEAGATIDVSGSVNALLPSSVNDLLVNVQPYQLRDSAGNRLGGLRSAPVYVDARTLVQIAGGAYAGNTYTPGGLLEVSGYLGLVPHGIDEWTAQGGQVTLQAGTTAVGAGGTRTTGSVTTQAGSIINLTGGLVTYQAGPVRQSYLQGADGQVYDVNSAPGNLVYTGVYAGFVVQHPRWHVTETYDNPLLTPSAVFDPAYAVGRDAGTLTVSAPTVALDGAAYAGVTTGQYQTTPRPASVSDPYALAQTDLPLAGGLRIGDYVAGILGDGVTANTQYQTDFLITADRALLRAGEAGAARTSTIDAAMASQDGFASLSIVTNGGIDVAAPLTLAPGGSLSLAGGSVTIDAGLVAHAGSISLGDTVPIGTAGAALSPVLLGPATGGVRSPISLGAGATLDASGAWTNLVTNPGVVAGVALANGGSVFVSSARGLSLQAGSAIDVSSGGVVLTSGRLAAASGGNVTITADLLPGSVGGAAADPVTLGASIGGYGYSGAGALSLTVPVVRIGGASAVLPGDSVVLAPGFFAAGFASYAVNGFAGVTVAPGTQVPVVMPVYEVDAPLLVPTGGDPRTAYQLVLPPLYLRSPDSPSFTERAGASLVLQSVTDTSFPAVGNSGGAVVIGQGAAISVDPGPRNGIAIDAYGQVTVLGTLRAQGGTVKVANVRYEISADTNPANASTLNYVAGQSVWLGDGSLIDVSGVATVFNGPLGARFGNVTAGGSILLGGDGGASASSTVTTDAQVILRPGATLDANGAAAVIDLVPGPVIGSFLSSPHPTSVASNGGTIVARSYNGVVLDGAFTAGAGGPGAAGGALVLRDDPFFRQEFNDIPVGLLQPKQVILSQRTVSTLGTLATLRPGQAIPQGDIGLIRLSQDQIAAGGFGQIDLFAQDSIGFDGDVALTAGQSIILNSPLIGAAPAAAPGVPHEVAGTADSIAAPYVALIGYSPTGAYGAHGVDSQGPTLTTLHGTGSLVVDAGLIDLGNTLYLGGTKTILNPISSQGSTVSIVSHGHTVAATGTYTADVPGFAEISLDSTGDVRLLGGSAAAGFFSTAGNLTITSSQLYPVTNAAGTLSAGDDGSAKHDPYGGHTITVLGAGSGAPAPESVGGSIALAADVIIQDGTVRAPFGTIRLGATTLDESNGYPYSSLVELGARSVTSVSLAGETVPFGGTVDGVNYLYSGQPVSLLPSPGIAIDAQSVQASPGSILDLRGGGTLSGAGFIAGRGGSVDVLRTPLLDPVGGVTVQPNATDQVFAILPGNASPYAPAVSLSDGSNAGYALPAIGEQITVGGGVPGLAAGTYTLLPAYYALLPGSGGYRVELTSGTIPAGFADGVGNYTTIAPVVQRIAGTGIASSVPIAALFTSAQGVRELSQYDEETYGQFEVANAALFGNPRPFLPQDAGTLTLAYPATIGTSPALSIDPGSLLQAPAVGGYGLTLQVTVNPNPSSSTIPSITVVGAAGDTAPGSVVLDASVLDALHLPRLVIGGTLSTAPQSANQIDVTGVASAVTIAPDATLTAGEVLLTTQDPGTITLAGSAGQGARISTIGAGPTAFDTTGSGYYFNNDANFNAPVLDVSNGTIVFVPNGNASGSRIDIGAGAQLLAGGSLDVEAPPGTTVGIDGSARLGASVVNLVVSSVNILPAGGGGGLAAALPPGLDLTDTSLAALLGGDPAQGIPAVGTLNLTAAQAVNIVGGAAVDFAATALVLDTPALYGFGAAGDQASLTAASFTWGGLAATSSVNGSSTVSAVPGGQISGSAANVTGGLTISAGTITLGFGPQGRPNDQVQFDRLVAGFGSVTLQASGEITANGQSSLSAYETVPVFGQPGTLGNLTLVTPLLTTAPAARLKLTAGGALSVQLPPGAAPASTGSILAQGGEIDLLAGSIAIDAPVALPAGRLAVIAEGDITMGQGAVIDLSGRATPIFDQVAHSPGGTFAAESTAGNFSDAGTIDVSATGAAAGAISVSALGSAGLGGRVAISGPIIGGASGTTALGSPAMPGSFSVLAGGLVTATGSALDALNALLDTGGVFGARAFELATGDVTIDRTVTAHHVSITADTGSIDVVGTIDASGVGPGSISLSAGQGLNLGTGSLLDAHATSIAHDSYGLPIDAENRAHVTLGVSAGLIVLQGGARIDVSYPAAQNAVTQGRQVTVLADGAQGQVTLDAPRVSPDGNIADANGLAVSAGTGPVAITGAQSIDVFAFRTYTPTDPYGTVAQSAASAPPPTSGTIVTLDQINADNLAFATALGANAGALRPLLAGLLGNPGFNLLPGVEIASGAASHGSLTVTGDIDLSSYRYSAPAGLGLQTGAAPGSGEPGALVLRAAANLVVNGSITDGFLAPPDAPQPNGGTQYYLRSDAKDWTLQSGTPEPASADVVLPASAFAINPGLQLAAGTTIATGRPVSLNYDITVASATITPSTPIPFAFTSLGAVRVPAGGLIATAAIVERDGTTFAAGQLVPGGTVLRNGTRFAPGTVLPITVNTANDTIVPAGTSLALFSGPLTLSQDTGAAIGGVQTESLPADALLPSTSTPVFVTNRGTLAQGALLDLRQTMTNAAGGDPAQGYLYPLAQLMPAGSQSWDISLVAGADLASADRLALLPRTSLAGGALAARADAIGQAPGSLILADEHMARITRGTLSAAQPAFSVIRTGTGSLDLLAGGDVDQTSLFGIYTAGAQSASVSPAFDSARYQQGAGGILSGQGRDTATANALLAQTYAAYYPTGGGDVRVLAQGSLTGDQVDALPNAFNLPLGLTSASIGDWLWRQGTTAVAGDGNTPQPTAWWINFGTFLMPLDSGNQVSLGDIPQLVGFEGIGTLGGGNVTVSAGGDAGQITNRGSNTRGEGLVVAVGSTGRVLPGAAIPELTGGGSLTLDVAGNINPLDTTLYTGATENLQGVVADLRGQATISAGAIGRISPDFNPVPNDPRPLDPFVPTDGLPTDGIVVAPGDATIDVSTLRDLVLAGAADPGRVTEQNLTRLAGPQAGRQAGSGAIAAASAFSLWQDGTALSLFAAGGNVTPITTPAEALSGGQIGNDAPTDLRYVYPPTLLATAASGDIIYGGNASAAALNTIETAPSPDGQVSFLAGGRIIASGPTVDTSPATLSVDISGADPLSVSTPFRPAFETTNRGTASFTNVTSPLAADVGQAQMVSPELELFAFAADTPTTSTPVHQADPQPARFYAATGDIVDFQSGETLYFPPTNGATFDPSTWYLAAKPVWIEAAGDIVSSGTRPGVFPGATAFATQQNFEATPATPALSSGNLFYNVGTDPISVVSAGRDILSGYVYVGGPGLLEVDAGRNLYQAGGAGLAFGGIKSLGSLVAGAPVSLTGGAGIAVLAGIGGGTATAGFADLYFDPLNQADLSLPLSDPRNAGKVQLAYGGALLSFLAANSAYTSADGDPLAYFGTLSPHVQDVLVRQVFFEELLASGRQYNDATSRFFGSYARGRQAIDALFPSRAPEASPGTPAGYGGAFTSYSGTVTLAQASGTGTVATIDGGIATLFGGGVQVLDPGGQVELGIPGGPAPGPGSGIVTFGTGDIAIYALDSVLLGKSRIFTTAGGNIQVWSSQGDINAGQGANTTQVFSPNLITYDAVGDLTLTPTVPTSGAGIATLAPIPGITPGNVDLTAPSGVIDAGEAGIRVSGNVNLAALSILNAGNIQVQGKGTGLPSFSGPSVQAETAASAASGASVQAAQAARPTAQAPEPSIIEVSVTISPQPAADGTGSDQDRRRRPAR